MTKLLADYLTEDQLAKELNRSIWTLRLWRRKRIGPPWVNMSGAKNAAAIYRRASVVKWLEAQEVQPARERRGR